MKRQDYVAPQVELAEVVVESGIANSVIYGNVIGDAYEEDFGEF